MAIFLDVLKRELNWIYGVTDTTFLQSAVSLMNEWDKYVYTREHKLYLFIYLLWSQYFMYNMYMR
jgi:hypothetical protein